LKTKSTLAAVFCNGLQRTAC